MDNLKKVLKEEIPKLRELGHRFTNKEITSNEFKATSGGMGVYAQLGGEKFMIRMRIPSGVLSVNKFKTLYELAKKHSLEKVHLTTRQAIQLHDISIDSVCDIMEEALKYDIYTRGGGGNFPRNVSLSPLTGVDVEEEFDVTEYAMAVNEYFMNKITTYKLPRKLKVSFSSSKKDSGNATIADLGFLATKQDENEYFKVYIGGGIGKNPSIAVEFDELVATKDVLYHVEAITRLFVAEGNYENRNKARIRYIVERMGADEFLKCYKKHLQEVKNELELDLQVETTVCNKEGIIINEKHVRLVGQKQKGLYSVYFHPTNGQLSMEVYKVILDKIENMESIEIRLSMDEGMYIRNLNGNEAKEILDLTQDLGGETKLEQSVACIGVPVCQIGIGESQSTLNEILDFFKDNNFTKDILPSIRISGCPNSCGTHQLGKIGLAGKKKKIDGVLKDIFEVFIGGEKGLNKTKLAQSVGSVKRDDIPQFLYDLAKTIDESGLTYDSYIETKNEELRRIIEKYLV
ncbi:MAG: nitrite/sulfite reductase [Peptostreptococcaceae bacterium]